MRMNCLCASTLMEQQAVPVLSRGQLAKELCEKLPVLGFDKIESDFPTVALTEDMMQFVATHASQKFHFISMPHASSGAICQIRPSDASSAAVCGVKAREGFIRPRFR